MKCLDDCHTYEIDQYGKDKPVYGSALPQILHFYEMRHDGTKIDGVTNEEVIRVLIHRMKVLNGDEPIVLHPGMPFPTIRMRFTQMGIPGEVDPYRKFRCRENSLAITKLEEALMWLEKRTADREARKVEGDT